MSKQIHYILRDLTQEVKDGKTHYIDATQFTKQDNKGSIGNLEAAFPKGFINDLATKTISIRFEPTIEIVATRRFPIVKQRCDATHGRP